MGKKRRREPNYELRADPTPQRMLKVGYDYEEGDDRGQKVLRIIFPLEAARKAEKITEKQYHAGMGYYEAWYHGGFSGSTRGTTDGEYYHCSMSGRTFLAGSEAVEAARAAYRSYWRKLGGSRALWLEGIVCYDCPIDDMDLFTFCLDKIS